MDKEQYYNSIKNLLYKKFDELKLYDNPNGLVSYLHYDRDDYAQIRIFKHTGRVFYYHGFAKKLFKFIRLEYEDFEIILGRWVEEKFKIHVKSIRQTTDVRIPGFNSNFFT